ncbi:MAG: acyl-CoA dehydrogenase family protein, partial [Chloroflexi bacterium]|nr:acyl-CoA dehydrogenase family protein [Chloroflexota bacterium]
MDFRFSQQDEAFRGEVAQFVERELPWDWREQSLDPEEPEDLVLVRQFKKKLADRGWLTMAWPAEYGGKAAPHIQQMVFNEEMAYRGIPAGDMGIRMAGPILMLYGTEEQKQFFLPRIAQADIVWAQGYSEPDSGSDLASLQTRAVEDGDDFVINGAKIWNGAHAGADWMFMLARTDTDAPKHRGISFLLTEMDQPGIKVEKIPMMWNAYRSLVTFNDARVPKKNLVGELNRGWYVGAALLDFERSGVDRPARARRVLEDLVDFCKQNRRNGKTLAEDPLIRHRLANMAVEIEACRLMCYQVAWMQSQGQIPNKEASIAKVFGSEMMQRLYGLGMELL